MPSALRAAAVPVLLAALTALAALVLALVVTPAAAVTVFGQDLRLGAVSPTALRSWSGPGQADLFGEGPVPTVQSFEGIIRPRLVWQRFDRDPAAADFIEMSPTSGATFRTREVGTALADGWTVYLLRLAAVAALLAGAMRLALIGSAAVLRGGRLSTPSRRAGVLTVAATMVLAVTFAATSAALTVRSAQSQLSQVRTLADLTGTAPLVPPPVLAAAATEGAQLAVIGDSTAAGVGNDPPARPGPDDEVCGRSRDAYARVLGAALQLPAINLACSSATIDSGLLGPQQESGRTLASQVGVLKGLGSLKAVVVSIGANDVGWADFLRLCFGLERCDDQFSERLFQSRLDMFRIRYAQLLQQLSELPGHPAVVVVLYYDPFGESFDCPALTDPDQPLQPPAGYGFAPLGPDDQEVKIRTKIEPLRSELAALNEVLERGAAAFGYRAVTPRFEGHALCSPQPWVQGMSERYPFHPNAAGELAIATAALPELVSLLTAAA